MRLGLSNLRLHLLRSILTALGIILGVAAVITMVSIGEGSKREALLQLERLGATNIIVRSQKPPTGQGGGGGSTGSWVSKFGLTRADLAVIEDVFADAEAVVPLKRIGSELWRGAQRKRAQAFGVTPGLVDSMKLKIARGRAISQADMDASAMVCVIGAEVAKELFPLDDPLEQTLRIDDKSFQIVGVMAPIGLAGGAGGALVGRDLNLDVHVPMMTARMVFGDTVVTRSNGSFEANEVEVAEVIITSRSRDDVPTDAALLRRVLEQRRPGLPDVGVVVPYELLEEAERSQLTWNLVLGAIASISLLVGGIGIMNIMLASVTERTREIGIRRALGATRTHIVGQFLVETGVLSAIGGIVGVTLGVAISFGIDYGVPLLPDAPVIGRFFPPDVNLPTAITMWSIGVAFVVATATGLIFGIYPAMQAARQDPIVALRHD